MGAPRIDQRADWPFIQNGAVTLFLKEKVLDEAVQTMIREGYAVHHIDCGTEAGMMRDFSRALRWNEQFGYEPEQLNLNALNDAVCCEPCEERPRIVLVLNRFAGFLKWGKESAHEVLDIIEYQSRNHLLFGERLLAFVRINDPNFRTEKLGGRPAIWNRAEWFMKSRGIRE